MSFLHPHLLWSIPLLGGLMGVASRVRRHRTERVRRYLTGRPGPEFWPREGPMPALPGSWRLRTALLVLAGSGLGTALAGPRTGVRRVPVPSPPKPLVLVLDVSRSMAVNDVPGTRLGEARILVRRVVERVPSTPVGLLVFADRPHLLLPPTRSRDLLYRYLDTVDPGMFTPQGTSVLAVLQVAKEMMTEGDLEEGTVFLLVSDGEHSDPPEEASRVAADVRSAGGRIDALGIGTSAGGVVPATGGPGSLLMSGVARAETGSEAPFSRARPEVLGALASRGGGISIPGAGAEEVSAYLQGLERWAGSMGGVRTEDVAVEVWPYFVLLALFLLTVETWMEVPGGKKAR